MNKLALILFFILPLIALSKSANILFFFALSTYSHRLVVWPLVEELTLRGHKVTFLSPYAPKSKINGVEEFIPVKLTEYMNKELGSDSSLVKLRMERNYKDFWYQFPRFGVGICQAILDSPETEDWLKSAKFDLVIVDALFNECALGFSWKFKAPFIQMGTSSVFQWFYDIYGIVPESSWIPDLQMHYDLPMTFWERIANTIRPLYWYFSRFWSMHNKLNVMLRERLNIPDMPDLEEYEKRAALHLQNNYFVTEFGRSLPPNVVNVGGLHIKNFNKKINSTLPKEISNFIKNDKFFYVSFGSAVQISQLSEKYHRIFLDTFGSFKNIKFIFKWEGDTPKNVPSNVLLLSWLPQQDILSHKNILGFMSHSGLLSMQEAVYHGVPLISFPCFAEQDYNAEKIERNLLGIRLELADVSAKILKDALDKILNNKIYKEKAQRASILFRDRPLTPLETSIFWIDYVLRHGEVKEMKPLGAESTFYERRLLDVYFFIYSILLLTLYFCYLITIKILKCLFWNKSAQSSKQKIKKK